MQTPQPNAAYIKRALLDEVSHAVTFRTTQEITPRTECSILSPRSLLVVLQAYYRCVAGGKSTCRSALLPLDLLQSLSFPMLFSLFSTLSRLLVQP